jgi:chromosome partitioning protein
MITSKHVIMLACYRESEMKKIAFINQKGGVGKTTSTINVGAGLARLGKKVLLIDSDPQANLTYSFGINPEDLQKTLYELVKGIAVGKGEAVRDFIRELDVGSKYKLYILPSSVALSGLETVIKDHPQKEFLFKKAISQLNDFDYVLIDCPPSLGLLTIGALSAADEVYVPVQAEFFALQGLDQISSVISIVKQSLNPQLKLGGVIGTKLNNRKLHKDVMSYLKANFKESVFKTVIRENIALAEAPSYGKDIFAYSPESNGAKDYSSLCEEIISTHINEGKVL